MSKHYFDPRLKISALNSNRLLTGKIIAAVGVELGRSSVIQLGDGEVQVNIEGSTRRSHVYMTQPTSSLANDNSIELPTMIDALKRASAKTINVVMPYCDYAYQDRKACVRGPIAAKLATDMTQKTGTTWMLTLDLHAVQIQGFFDIPADHLMGTPPTANYFLERGTRGDDVAVVSPDHDDITQARKLAEFLKFPTAIIDKRHPKVNAAEIMNIIGQVKGKTYVLIDDTTGIAGMITSAASVLKKAGATSVYVPYIHPVLSSLAL